MILHGNLPEKSIETVLFDFDGVIADTEAVFAVFDCNLLNEVLQSLSLEPLLTPDFIRTLAGKNDDQKLVFIAKKYGFDPAPLTEGFLKKRNELRQTLFSDNKVSLAHSLLEFLEKFKDRYYLATNKNRQNVTRDIINMGILEHFENIIGCHENGLNKKPAPDILLHAAKLAGFNPKNTAYIGDNNIDMLAAQNAGMIPVGFIIERDNTDYSARIEGLIDAGAQLVINSMNDLEPLMKQEAA